MTSPISAVPTLRKNTWVTDPSQIIAYEIAYFIKAPASASDTARSSMVSYMDIVSKNIDIPTVCGMITTALNGVFTRIYGNGNSNVIVSNSTSDGINYTLTIDASVTVDGETYVTSTDISTDSTGHIVLNF